MNRRLKVPILIGCICVALSVICLGWSAIFVMTASEATGKVVAVTREPSDMWTATFTFADANGVLHTKETSRQSPNTYWSIREGDNVAVLYYPASPQNAEIDSFATLWFTPVLILAVALFFILGGSVMAFVMSLAQATPLERDATQKVQ